MCTGSGVLLCCVFIQETEAHTLQPTTVYTIVGITHKTFPNHLFIRIFMFGMMGCVTVMYACGFVKIFVNIQILSDISAGLLYG